MTTQRDQAAADVPKIDLDDESAIEIRYLADNLEKAREVLLRYRARCKSAEARLKQIMGLVAGRDHCEDAEELYFLLGQVIDIARGEQ